MKVLADRSVKFTAAETRRCLALIEKTESLPRYYRHFDMSTFFNSEAANANELEGQYALKNGGVRGCGTVACFIGHGPAAGILVPPRLVTRHEATPWTGGARAAYYSVDWNGYAELFLGEGWRDDRQRRAVWQWLFGGEWAGVDNHHWGAAARLRYLLAGRPLPEGCEWSMSQMSRAWRKLYRDLDKRYRA